MCEVICPWQQVAEVEPERCDRFIASIGDISVSFSMVRGVCYCNVHGTGRRYRLDEMSSEHADLVGRVKDYFGL